MANVISILLVGDDEDDISRLGHFFARSQTLEIISAHVDSLARAHEYLSTQKPDLIMLDLSLPEIVADRTLAGMVAAAPEVPVLVVTGTNNEAEGARAVALGAQDYLVKGQFDEAALFRAVHNAIERQGRMLSLRQSVTDELTGLLNRRGLFLLAEHHLKSAFRLQRSSLILSIDVDSLTALNEKFGRAAGDQALQAAGRLIRGTCRAADIVARLEGDEYVVLGLCAGDDSAQVVAHRLQDAVANHNQQAEPDQRLSLSCGALCVLHDAFETVESLLAKGEEALSAHRAQRRGGGASAADAGA
jgi:diguanylate cyclase (GGDEF)-like protein